MGICLLYYERLKPVKLAAKRTSNTVFVLTYKTLFAAGRGTFGVLTGEKNVFVFLTTFYIFQPYITWGLILPYYSRYTFPLNPPKQFAFLTEKSKLGATNRTRKRTTNRTRKRATDRTRKRTTNRTAKKGQ